MTDLDLQVLRGRILDEDTGRLRDHCDETGECLEDTAALIAEVERLRAWKADIYPALPSLRAAAARDHYQRPVVEAARALLGVGDTFDENPMATAHAVAALHTALNALDALKESHD